MSVKIWKTPARIIPLPVCLFLAAFILSMLFLPGATSATPHPSLNGFPRIGVETTDYEQTVFDGIADVGAKYVRMSLSWRQIEPGNTPPANFNWSYYDLIFSQVISAGITPLVIVLDCPSWAWRCNSDELRVSDNS